MGSSFIGPCRAIPPCDISSARFHAEQICRFWAANCTKNAFGGHLLGSYSAAPDALAAYKGKGERTRKGRVRNRQGRDKKDVKG